MKYCKTKKDYSDDWSNTPYIKRIYKDRAFERESEIERLDREKNARDSYDFAYSDDERIAKALELYEKALDEIKTARSVYICDMSDYDRNGRLNTLALKAAEALYNVIEYLNKIK